MFCGRVLGFKVLRDVTVKLCGRELSFRVLLMDGNAMFCWRE
jgi:hypothetical protein